MANGPEVLRGKRLNHLDGVAVGVEAVDGRNMADFSVEAFGQDGGFAIRFRPCIDRLLEEGVSRQDPGPCGVEVLVVMDNIHPQHLRVGQLACGHQNRAVAVRHDHLPPFQARAAHRPDGHLSKCAMGRGHGKG